MAQCDLLRPGCTPCSRSGLECGGYEVSRVFINSSQETWPKGSVYANPAHQASISVQLGHQAVAAPTLDSSSLAQSAYEELYLHAFLDAYLPRGHGCATGDGRWTSVVRETCRDDDALKLALLTNGLAAVGKRAAQGWMVRESLRVYGRSLGELSKALRTPARAQKNCSLLAATRLLSTFEVGHYQWAELTCLFPYPHPHIFFLCL